MQACMEYLGQEPHAWLSRLLFHAGSTARSASAKSTAGSAAPAAEALEPEKSQSPELKRLTLERRMHLQTIRLVRQSEVGERGIV